MNGKARSVDSCSSGRQYVTILASIKKAFRAVFIFAIFLRLFVVLWLNTGTNENMTFHFHFLVEWRNDTCRVRAKLVYCRNEHPRSQKKSTKSIFITANVSMSHYMSMSMYAVREFCNTWSITFSSLGISKDRWCKETWSLIRFPVTRTNSPDIWQTNSKR